MSDRRLAAILAFIALWRQDRMAAWLFAADGQKIDVDADELVGMCVADPRDFSGGDRFTKRLVGTRSPSGTELMGSTASGAAHVPRLGVQVRASEPRDGTRAPSG
jgi:hypothetical protein